MTNREIKRRITSVKETVKITKAMYSISVAKMMGVRASLDAATRYADGMKGIMDVVSAAFPQGNYFSERGERTGFIVISSDKGLCGDYNAAIFEKAKEELRSTKESSIFTIGSVVRDMLSKNGLEADVEYLRASAVHGTSEAIAKDICDLYDSDMLDVVKIVYTASATSGVVVERLLPIARGTASVEIEPKNHATMRKCVCEYIAARVRQALLASSLAEHTIRARVMSQSTDNAEEMIEDLTAKYNRIRQESITRALQDVSGADREV